MSNLLMLKAFLFLGTENLLSFTEIRNERDQRSGGGRRWGEELQQQLEEIRATIEIKRNRYPERTEKTVPLCLWEGGSDGKSFTSRESLWRHRDTCICSCVWMYVCMEQAKGIWPKAKVTNYSLTGMGQNKAFSYFLISHYTFIITLANIFECLLRDRGYTRHFQCSFLSHRGNRFDMTKWSEKTGKPKGHCTTMSLAHSLDHTMKLPDSLVRYLALKLNPTILPIMKNLTS